MEHCEYCGIAFPIEIVHIHKLWCQCKYCSNRVVWDQAEGLGCTIYGVFWLQTGGPMEQFCRPPMNCQRRKTHIDVAS